MASRSLADPHAEAAFYREHEPAAALSEAIAELERDLAQDEFDPQPLDALTARLGLNQADRELLVLAAAPELDRAFERLYGYVQDDAGRRFATPHLASELLDPEVLARLAPDAPLRRLGLLALAPTDDGWGSRPLRVDERVRWHLRGLEALDQDVASLLRPIRDPARLGSAALLAVRLAELLAERTPWPLVQIVGPVHAGARAVGATACASLGLQLVALAPNAAERCREREQLTDLLEREAALRRWRYGSTTHPSMAGEIWPKTSAHPCCAGATSGSEPMRRSWPYRLAHPPARSCASAGYRFSAPGSTLSRSPSSSSSSRGRYPPLWRTRRRARPFAGATPPDSADVWNACRARARVHADGLARPIEANDCSDRLVLPEEAITQLDELAAQAAHRARVYDDWGFGSPSAARPRRRRRCSPGRVARGRRWRRKHWRRASGLISTRIDLAGIVIEIDRRDRKTPAPHL